MTRTTKSLHDRLAEGIVFGAEGYVFELERRGHIKAGPYVPEVILDEPEAVTRLHREFLNAGSDVMVALTYYAHREKLRQLGREGDLEAMNRQAVRLANEVAREGDALVAGNICNTWAYDMNDVATSSAVVRAQYDEQLGWAVDEGIDFVISETHDYLGEALISVEACKAYGLPVVVNFATVDKEKTVDGHDFIDACKAVAGAGADVVGLNCSRGPETMLPLLRRLRQEVSTPVAALPIPYRTTKEHPSFEGTPGYPLDLESMFLSRYDMAKFAAAAQDIGINYLGICCGGGPHHVRAMVEAIGRTAPASRYSPAMELHPVFRPDDADVDVTGWTEQPVEA